QLPGRRQRTSTRRIPRRHAVSAADHPITSQDVRFGSKSVERVNEWGTCKGLQSNLP
ncbi:hypothetical protein IscW_ISCW005753, partial [Ixodes scapularis]